MKLKHIKLLFFIFSTLIFFHSTSCSQTQSFYVKPSQTDSSYSPTEDSIFIAINTSNSNGKLVLFLGGGYSSPKDYWAFCYKSATLGFDAISLSYNNQIGVASFAENPDSLIFDKIRQEICFGTPVCDYISVDTLHSIRVRFIKLVQYLKSNYPSHNWSQYLTNDEPNWSKIILAGHSLGSGNALYISKYFNVDRVLMFSGPNDYSTYYNRPAQWLSKLGVTETNRLFSYLSLLDEVVPFERQYSNIVALGLLAKDDTTLVDFTTPPYSNSHCLYTVQPPGLGVLYHNSTTLNSAINRSVWEYMLTTDIITSVMEKDRFIYDSNVIIFPNPTNRLVNIISNNIVKGIIFYDITGKRVISYSENDLAKILLPENITSGMFILRIETENKIFTKKLLVIK